MLVIHSQLLHAMLAQARSDHPLETCGVIAGLEGFNEPLRLIPMKNIAQSEAFFEFDSQEHLLVWRDMDGRGEEPVVIYHSHTSSAAFPSHSDVAYATEPDAHYVIIPTDSNYGEEIRSFRILDGMITEERVQIVNDYKSGASPVLTN